MVNLDDLIKYEPECTRLDFKRVQYKKGSQGEKAYEDLIKDIMSMANADIEDDRYIIIGVDYKNSSDRVIIGINKSEFIDSASYQQLIRENVEPRIIFDYIPHEIEGRCLGIFKITRCDNQPYMMKKEYGNLKKGDCFIRIGDFQSKMTREDHDKIMAKKIKTTSEEKDRIEKKRGRLEKEMELLIAPLYSKISNPNVRKLHITAREGEAVRKEHRSFWELAKQNMHLTQDEVLYKKLELCIECLNDYDKLDKSMDKEVKMLEHTFDNYVKADSANLPKLLKERHKTLCKELNDLEK